MYLTKKGGFTSVLFKALRVIKEETPSQRQRLFRRVLKRFLFHIRASAFRIIIYESSIPR